MKHAENSGSERLDFKIFCGGGQQSTMTTKLARNLYVSAHASHVKKTNKQIKKKLTWRHGDDDQQL